MTLKSVAIVYTNCLIYERYKGLPLMCNFKVFGVKPIFKLCIEIKSRSKSAPKAPQTATRSRLRATSVCYFCLSLKCFFDRRRCFKYLCEEDIAITINSVRDVIN